MYVTPTLYYIYNLSGKQPWKTTMGTTFCLGDFNLVPDIHV